MDISRLPADVLGTIITRMTVNDIDSLCRTNKHMYDFCMAKTENHGLIWKNLIINQFKPTGLLTEENLVEAGRRHCNGNICYNYLVYKQLATLLEPSEQTGEDVGIVSKIIIDVNNPWLGFLMFQTKQLIEDETREHKPVPDAYMRKYIMDAIAKTMVTNMTYMVEIGGIKSRVMDEIYETIDQLMVPMTKEELEKNNKLIRKETVPIGRFPIPNGAPMPNGAPIRYLPEP